jgi:hypothetical protein
MKYLPIAAALLVLAAAEANAICPGDRVLYLNLCWNKNSAGLPPPAAYDKPFPGAVTINTAKDMDEMASWCSPHPLAGQVLGCSFHYVHSLTPDLRYARCYIYIAPESYIRKFYGATPETVLRHEIGHCNGWPGDHQR